MDEPPQISNEEEEQNKSETERKIKREVVTFRDFHHENDFEELVKTIVTLIDVDDQDRLREMEEWILKDQGTWVLAESFTEFLGRVLHDQSLPQNGRVAMLRLIAYGAVNDDIVLILHSDRKSHQMMNYFYKIDRHSIDEQEAIALLVANLFETNSPSEWLLYISEWNITSSDSTPISNVRVTTKVAITALLGDTPKLAEYGTAIMFNLSSREVKSAIFDDVCSELAMAILQFLLERRSETHVFRCLTALEKFASLSRDVPQLIQMIGPQPSKFNAISQRIDVLIQQLETKHLSKVRM